MSFIAPFWQGCSSAPPEQLMTETFEYIVANANIFNTLLSNGGSPSFRTALQNAMITNFRKSHKGEKANSSEQEITNQFIASAIAGSIEWWIKEKPQVPPETMVTTMLSLLSKLQ